jgi:uncharacterized protein (UPF0332 family)
MIRPDNFLNLADDLAQRGSEADWRTAVSRAYYAAFHAARELLSALGFQVPRASQAHGYLWKRLANCGDPVITLAGNDLNHLQSERNRSDYDIHLTVNQANAQRRAQLARLVVHRFTGGLVDPVRTQIRDTMRDYERNVLHDITWQGP